MYFRTLAATAALTAGLFTAGLANAQLPPSADLDRDGLISIVEMEALMPDQPFDFISTVYQALDQNHDGLLTVAEAGRENPGPITFAPPIITAMMAPFEKADTDSNGLITASELKAHGGPPEQLAFVDQYIGTADSNQDGGVSKAEWDANRPTVTRKASN